MTWQEVTMFVVLVLCVTTIIISLIRTRVRESTIIDTEDEILIRAYDEPSAWSVTTITTTRNSDEGDTGDKSSKKCDKCRCNRKGNCNPQSKFT